MIISNSINATAVAYNKHILQIQLQFISGDAEENMAAIFL